MKNIARRIAGCLAVAFFPLAAFGGPVNVNTADAETLSAELNGVGLSRAQAIVEYRETHGPFRSVEQLVEVTGIGTRTLELNRHNIRLSDDDASRR